MWIQRFCGSPLLIILMAFSGCTERGGDTQRFVELRERSRKEIARLESRLKSYEREASSYREEIASLERDLASARERVREEWHGGKTVDAVKPGRGATGAGPAAAPEATARAVEPATAPSIAQLLEQFASEYQESVEEGRREQFKAELGAYAAELRAGAAVTDMAQKKARTLESLQERIAGSTDEGERELLQRRLEKIQSASPEDLQGVLSYYEEIDNNQALNRMMEEYNISREDLRDFGIEPPPRSRWGPDVREIAGNLERFVDSYESLVDPGMRDQYRRDFDTYLSTLASRPSDAALLQRKSQMLSQLQEEYNAAGADEKARIKRQMERVERYSMERLRRQVESENLRGLRDLADKYGLPRSELRQSGVWAPRGRGQGPQ